MNSATSIDILSYHHTADGSVVRPSSSRPVLSKEISHFLPIEQLSVKNNTVPVQSRTNNTSKKTEMIQLPKINRASRLQNHEAPMVPHLHADQRVRSRSTSKEPQRILPKDKHKIVAFGRTTTVDNNETAPSTAPQAPRPASENARLRTDIEQLRQRVTANEKLRKEVEELQKTLKVVASSTKQVEVLTRENKHLQKELDETKKYFASEVQKSADLMKRVEELETQFVKFISAKNTKASPADDKSSISSSIERSYTKVPAPTPLKQSPYLKKDNNLFSRLSPARNKEIQRIERLRPDRKANNDSYDEMENRAPRNHIEVSCYQSKRHEIYTEFCDDDDQLPESVCYKRAEEASPNRRSNKTRHTRKNDFKAARKQLASNQVIDLAETNGYNEFNFN